MAISGSRRKAPLVLLVEDCAEIADLFGQALADGGFLVRPVSTLADAEAIVASGTKPDIVVMDRDLPDGDGFSLAARWAASADAAGGRSVPVIGFTASPVHEALEAAERAGMVGFVAKPCPPGKLVDLVRLLLRPGHHALAAC
jgi:response regulator NasT